MARSLSILALVLLAACARGEPAGSERVGPGYTVGGGTWNTGGGITVAVRAFEKNGQTIVCGAWTTDRQSAMTYAYNDDVMQVGSIYLGGKRLVQNLAFMSRVPQTDNISGARASCVASPVAWQPGFAEAEPWVRIPRYTVGDKNDDPSGGNPLVFRETARPDIVR